MAMKILSGSCSSDLSSLFGGAFYINRNRLTLAGIADSRANESLNSRVVAAQTINKSDHFIDHLISSLHSAHKSWYLVGREFTTLEIRDTLNPYLQSLLEEHGNFMVDLVKNFPTAPIKEKPALPIKLATHKYPSFVNYSSESKIKPLVEFLLDLGVAKSEIPKILVQRPHLCDIVYLPRTPQSQQAEGSGRVVNFLHELGLSGDSIGKVLTRFPASLWLSIEGNVKPVTKFFYEKGFSVEDIGTMVSRLPNLYALSLTGSLIPKREFFLTMGYSKPELIKFP
ncbi:hypothetical protein Pint_26820 [Pistacia integerrima]|uniref:Uncharacterized protein n=1 Tax=Pistacia integerrima TaxID=434235 RepID=A0ACC0YR04_9ROSI|nr:hypothetical protein Pint_26820 [Pistacia integerrima]